MLITSAYFREYEEINVDKTNICRKLPFANCTAAVLTLLALAAPTAIAKESAPNEAVVERLDAEGCHAIAGCYDYEKSIPLEPRVVERLEKEKTIREKIVFRGVQGFLVPAYLQWPTEAKGPLRCVLLLHGWSGSKENWWVDDNYISGGIARKALLAAGFAVMALDAQCHGDRIALNDYAPVNHYADPNATVAGRKGYFALPEIYIQTVRDYRRAIDYLESRPEIDGKRIGMLGYSMGGHQTFLLTGVEPRIKAAVSVAAPAEKSKWSLIAPQNFIDGIGDRPFLTIAGRSDELCSLAHAQARHAMIKSPVKDQVLFDAGHKLPAEYVPHAVNWLQKYL